MSPIRIQRRRTKGWRTPPNTRYVGRPSRYENPFTIEAVPGDWFVVDPFGLPSCFVAGEHFDTRRAAHQYAVDRFRDYYINSRFSPDLLAELRRDLGGRNLSCWCPLDLPCHADVLLELANGEGVEL